MYPSLYPSLHRGVESTRGISNRDSAFARLLKAARASQSFLKNTPGYTHAPLLQHYGVRTKWLDLVDNVWVALWFACHSAVALGRRQQSLYFETRRRPYPCNGKQEYVYVILVHAGKVNSASEPGVMTGPDSEVIDLRVAAPSLYLRPHAQHAVLMKRKGGCEFGDFDFSRLVVGTVRVELGDALSWLGAGNLLSVHTLFPPPHYDFGYRLLLDRMQADGDINLGAIHQICA
jgi:hypothetical protein